MKKLLLLEEDCEGELC